MGFSNVFVLCNILNNFKYVWLGLDLDLGS
jgi:hypothetical protein